MQTQKKIFLIDSVVAARSLLKTQKLTDQDIVFSLHYSVKNFMKQKNIMCSDISESLSSEILRNLCQKTSKKYETILNNLDDVLGSQICEQLQWPQMRIFYTLFKYPVGHISGVGSEILEYWLQHYTRSNEISAIYFFYDKSLNINLITSLIETIQIFSKKNNLELILIGIATPFSIKKRITKKINLWKRLYAIRTELASHLLNKIQSRLLRRKTLNKNQSTALIFHHENSFQWILSKLGMQIFLYPEKKLENIPGISSEESKKNLNKIKYILQKWLEETTTDPITKNIVTYVNIQAETIFLPWIYFSQFQKIYPIKVAAWHKPLVLEFSSHLIVEGLLCSGVLVFGRQHGSAYGDQNLDDYHFDSDFDRCTHWFSYGLTEIEFTKTYPERKPLCQLIAGGNPQPQFKKNVKKIDIAFPLSNCIHLGDFGRRLEAKIAQNQSHILQILEQRKDLKIIIKPLMNYDEYIVSQTIQLRQLKHAQVIDYLSWKDFLICYSPNLIILEHFSTPLYDILGLDVDIFLLYEEVYLLSEYAFNLLKKRVHFFDNIDMMTQAILQYGKVPLPKLRNQEFYQFFVNRGSLEEAVTQVFKQSTR